MEQLTQELKSGRMEVLEVPFPVLGKGSLLIRNVYSVISAGTEGKTVRDARLGYIGKAMSRSKELKQVISLIRSQGFRDTYRMVMNRLEAPSALGYSCAGEVIAVGEGISDIKAGDFVACGGSDAVHAEIVAVPRNLCVPIPEGVELKHAAFTTLASIAMQGIRQSELKLGENCVVIGLGLIGQLTMQILEASGIKAIGLDIDQQQVDKVRSLGMQAFQRNQEGIEEYIIRSTGGHGTDAVIITAGSSSLDPVEFAGRVCRRRAKVVIVGAVPTGFSRENYYRKELDLRMSSSYGPGRYDSNYEEKGNDYPIGYVRWTENRNMQAFVALLAAGKLNIDALITHIFTLEQAPEAYAMILGRSEPYTGIVIRYDEEERPLQRRVELSAAAPAAKSMATVAFVGAGSFAQNMLLPALKGKVNFGGIATGKGNHSLFVGKKYGFRFCTDNPSEVISDAAADLIFITTRHNLHGEYVLQALKNGKDVFVEKPLAMNMQELLQIRETYAALEAKPRLMVGFNRRFSPHVVKLKNTFRDEQSKAIHIRVNAGMLPKDHWVHDPETGGGRIVGEACHFIDLARHIAGSPITRVFAMASAGAATPPDTVAITLEFMNGSVAGISYFSNGNKKLDKEFIEVFCDGNVYRIDDFRRSTLYGKATSALKSKGQDKGHAPEMEALISAVRQGKPSPVPFEESWESMAATFAVEHSLRSGQALSLQEFILQAESDTKR